MFLAREDFHTQQLIHIHWSKVKRLGFNKETSGIDLVIKKKLKNVGFLVRSSVIQSLKRRLPTKSISEQVHQKMYVVL